MSSSSASTEEEILVQPPAQHADSEKGSMSEASNSTSEIDENEILSVLPTSSTMIFPARRYEHHFAEILGENEPEVIADESEMQSDDNENDRPGLLDRFEISDMMQRLFDETLSMSTASDIPALRTSETDRAADMVQSDQAGEEQTRGVGGITPPPAATAEQPFYRVNSGDSSVDERPWPVRHSPRRRSFSPIPDVERRAMSPGLRRRLRNFRPVQTTTESTSSSYEIESSTDGVPQPAQHLTQDMIRELDEQAQQSMAGNDPFFRGEVGDHDWLCDLYNNILKCASAGISWEDFLADFERLKILKKSRLPTSSSTGFAYSEASS